MIEFVLLLIAAPALAWLIRTYILGRDAWRNRPDSPPEREAEYLDWLRRKAPRLPGGYAWGIEAFSAPDDSDGRFFEVRLIDIARRSYAMVATYEAPLGVTPPAHFTAATLQAMREHRRFVAHRGDPPEARYFT